PDLVIHCAGFGLYGATIDLPVKEQIDMVEVHCIAYMEIAIESAKMLKQSGKKGTILGISSAAAFFNYPYFNTYAASKGFIKQFSQSLDEEVKHLGIRVLAACPGQIATPFRKKAAKGKVEMATKFTMSIEKAVHHIWKQIQREIPVYIFHFPYRFITFASKFLPQSFLSRILKKTILQRIKK
ncbi:MAG: SDR family NAD(P)-dependent oxidoreductase, partial [Chlamydiae bacterium]|nr:SDR family NAD(P)-dependent oxidoreductase [Chlamydiota bacterium]